MERNSYSDQQSHASFQPKSIQPAIEPNQFAQPAQHSGSTNDLDSNRLGKARIWTTDRFQAAQNFVKSLGDTIASDHVLPALKGTTSSHQPLVGVIDSGFGANEHGRKIVEAIKKENPQAQIWKGGGVGTGGWSKSLVKFVDIAKASGHSRAVANLSFDLTEVHPDGSTSNRSQLTAEEQSALAYARDHNVLIVASSGNQGGAMSALGQASQPSDNLIVVGAANGSDRASYSSYGRGLDLVAEVGAAGTSLAAAKVTGTIAQMWSNNPGLSNRQINQTLTATSIDLNKPGWDAETGAGLLNATGAIGLAKHTVPEPNLFSNAPLVQQASNLAQESSFRGKAWTSTDGAIASERSNWDWSEIAHGALDVAGFIPVAGAVADVANAGLYAAEGDYANAALSAAAAVPGIGDAAAAVKLVNRGVEAVQVAHRATDTTQNIAARAIPSPPPSRPQSPIVPESTPPGRSRQPELERPPATSERQQPTPERSGSPEAAPRSGGGGVTRAVAATTAVATVAPYVAPLASEEAPRPNPSGSNPSPTQPYPDSTRTLSPPSGDQPNPTPGQVIVQPGATLWEIAQEHLGSGDRWTDLLEADGTTFTEQEANRLPIGTVVYLPTPAPSPSSLPEAPAPNTPISPSPTPTQLPSEQPNPAPGQITMRQGDTLWEIAQEQLGSGDRWTDLLKPDGNPFTAQEANRLPIGTIVHLPTVAPLSPSPSQAPMPPPIAPSPTPPNAAPLEITYPRETPPNAAPLEITYPRETPSDPATLEITYPKPLEVPISPGSTPSIGSSPPDNPPNLTPHIQGTPDLRYDVEITNSNAAPIPENMGETSSDELETSPRSSESEPDNAPYDYSGYDTRRFVQDGNVSRQLTKQEKERFWRTAAEDPTTPLSPYQREVIRETGSPPKWQHGVPGVRSPERLEVSHEPADRTQPNARERLVIRWGINHAQVDTQRRVSRRLKDAYEQQPEEMRERFSRELERWMD